MNAFAAALLNPEADLPEGLIDPMGRPAPRRFDVYRNNVTVSLMRALESAFPATRALVGADFFGAMALEFLRAHPPKTRILMLYGDEFADFISGFGPAGSLGYLPDIARLEQAIRVSYHAADAAAVDPALLASLTEAQILSARFTFAPAVQIVASDWPIHGIRNAALNGGPPPQMASQDVLILRPEFDPELHVLAPGGADFMRALVAGQTIGAAGLSQELTSTLAALITGGAIIGVSYDQVD